MGQKLAKISHKQTLGQGGDIFVFGGFQNCTIWEWGQSEHIGVDKSLGFWVT